MDGIYGAIGCHPLGASLNRDKGLELARKFISHPKVVAVGEVGELLIPESYKLMVTYRWFSITY